MLSFKKFKENDAPVAIVNGGEFDGKKIYIGDGLDGEAQKKNLWDNIDENDLIFRKKKYGREQMQLLRTLINIYHKNGKDKVNEYIEQYEIDPDFSQYEIDGLENVVELFKSKMDRDVEMSNKSIEMHDEGQIELLPIYTKEDDKRNTMYVCGANGSGKSYIVSQFTEKYRKMYPKRHIYLFSDKPHDDQLDKIPKLYRIPIVDDDETLLTDPYTCETLKNSLVIFDDIDSLPNTQKKYQVALYDLRDKIYKVGRSYGVSIISTNHLCTDYRNTKTCLNESEYLVIFCKSGSFGGIDYMLRKYCGFDKSTIQRIMSLPSRWVVIKKNFPLAIIHQKGCYLL